MIRLELFVLTIYMVINGILSQSPTRDTKLGTIIGVQHNGMFKGKSYTIDRFLGIPYAKTPSGDLRFRKPEAYGNFLNGTLMATQFGNSCPQVDTSGFEPQMVVTTEDCLSLNIFVPTQTADKPSGHAVMIFIHGGGFISGTSRKYLVDTLAARGNIIVVTINYRLWMFGFLNLQLSSAPGNVGFLDQQMAIQWVHDNIHSFGGDPNRVTVFGQSAGAISTSLQSLYPGNRGLINGVITASSSLFTGSVSENTIDIATLLASKLQCDTSNTSTILACLQHTSVEEIMQTLTRTMQENPMEGAQLFSRFTATIDGDFIKDKPRTLLNKPDSDEVQFLRSLNLMNGFNLGDGGLTAVIYDPSIISDDYSISRYAMNMVYIPLIYKSVFAPGMNDLPDELVSLIAHEYTDWNGPDDPMLLREQYTDMLRDITFGISTVEYARLHAGGKPSANNYLYLFEPETNGHVRQSPIWIHAVHGDELPFLFGFPAHLEMKTRNGSVAIPGDREFNLSDKMMTRWSNFAKSGDPNIQGEIIWPKFSTASEEYMKLDWNESADQYLLARETSFWYTLLSQVQSSLSTNVCVPGGVSSGTRVFVGWLMMCVCTITIIVFTRLI